MTAPLGRGRARAALRCRAHTVERIGVDVWIGDFEGDGTIAGG